MNHPPPSKDTGGTIILHNGKSTKNRFLSWRRPDSYGEVVDVHLPLALIALLILIVSFAGNYANIPLPDCTFLRSTGYPCAFCGFTRSSYAIASGKWTYALANSPLAFPLYLFILSVFLWNTAGLVLRITLQRGVWLRLKTGQGKWVLLISLILLAGNWAYRFGMGLK